MTNTEFAAFCEKYMRQGEQLVPGRLQAAIALLERVRSESSLELASHTVEGGASVVSHETMAESALARFRIMPLNKNHGRRSSNLPKWGQPLLDSLRVSKDANRLIVDVDALQALFADKLREMVEQNPFEVRVEARSIETIIGDLLEQADQRNKIGAVAQYLVGSKLQLRFPSLKIPVRQFNQHDDDDRRADFQIGDTAIEVALGSPDEKHVRQIEMILESTRAEVWLLVRSFRLSSWRVEVEKSIEKRLLQRLVLTAVESFVGQNVSELGAFAIAGKAMQLNSLFELYNSTWVDKLGPANIRVVLK